MQLDFLTALLQLQLIEQQDADFARKRAFRIDNAARNSRVDSTAAPVEGMGGARGEQRPEETPADGNPKP